MLACSSNSEAPLDPNQMKISSLLCSDAPDPNDTDSSCRTPTPVGLKTLAIAAALVEPTMNSTMQLKVKPKRKRATPTQVSILKLFYAKNPFPDTECRQYLADKLGMTPRSVQIWFQNQRQHEKAVAEQAHKRSTPVKNEENL